MNFHWPSFLLGYGAGIVSTVVAQRMRPVLTELAAAGFEFLEAAAAKMAMTREDIDDIIAEARARAGGAAAKEEAAAPPPRPRRPKARRAARRANGAAPADA
jgi:hypothetical protein